MPPSVALPSPLLVQAAKLQDARAWNQLLKAHEAQLYVYAAEMTGNEASARDIVQETFSSAIRHIGSLQNDCKFASWLFSIAHQKCVQFWRKQNKDARIFEEADEEALEQAVVDSPDPGSLLLSKERWEHYNRAIAALPETQRAVFLLRALEGFSVAEIADVLEIATVTVKSRLHYATQSLKEKIAQDL
jgi:RNA polymerase sigma-70 factor (ECF subfamily)